MQIWVGRCKIESKTKANDARSGALRWVPGPDPRHGPTVNTKLTGTLFVASNRPSWAPVEGFDYARMALVPGHRSGGAPTGLQTTCLQSGSQIPCPWEAPPSFENPPSFPPGVGGSLKVGRGSPHFFAGATLETR